MDSDSDSCNQIKVEKDIKQVINEKNDNNNKNINLNGTKSNPIILDSDNEDIEVDMEDIEKMVNYEILREKTKYLKKLLAKRRATIKERVEDMDIDESNNLIKNF